MPAGTISAPAAPCKTRPNTRTERVDAIPQSSDATANRIAPASTQRRRPKTSATRPAATISERQHVAVESPLQIAQICVQILTQCNQRYVDRRDIGVQDREDYSDHEQS
jgi:hypothetical protein